MKKIWILAFVKRGFIQKPEIYYNKYAANKRKLVLLQDFNPDFDELEAFEKIIHL